MANEFIEKAPETDVAISSRVRLARNLDIFPFPNKMSQEQGKEVLNKVRDSVFSKSGSFAQNLSFFDIQKLNPIDRQVLVEKHLISPDFNDTYPHRAVIISKDEKISIMINEEDHLRIQSIFFGMQLEKAWELCNRLDTMLEENINFAYSKNYGYLTCCPTNLGTGIRASLP
jgi:protein arginine kinase